ncbi:MAG TPA: hypothetical protein VJW20_20395 [Candidatus Angelobacter sp.]|nr:hypothetical protein [Candidatus Angelobacter sp.]
MKTAEERIAEGIATVVIIAAGLYFAGHAVAAWINGAFQAVTQ